MTTIAWDGATMAGDSASWYQDRKFLRNTPKVYGFIADGARWSTCGKMIFDKGDKVLVGGAGAVPAIQMFEQWMCGEGEKCWGIPDAAFLIAVEGKPLWFMETDNGVFIEMPDQHFSIGSGSGYAMGCMATGGNAIEAIKVAALYDPYTQAPVQAITFADCRAIVRTDDDLDGVPF